MIPLIVTDMVLDMMKESEMPASWVYVPDTGPSAILDHQNGYVVAVRRLITA
jgi:hypothetical protein